jgi:cobalt/nickel transport system permease protein
VHIQEGVLSNSPSGIAVLAGGAVVAALGTAIGLRRMDDESIPRVAVLGNAFFVGSLIHLPVGVTSVHLVLNGLAGVILGWTCFPAILIALILQAVLFGFGGLTTLGLNLLNLALPAVGCHYLVDILWRTHRTRWEFTGGFLAGAGAVLGASILTATSLLAGGGEFRYIARGIVLAHVPVAAAEGLVTGSVVAFLRRVRPEVLDAPVAGGGAAGQDE